MENQSDLKKRNYIRYLPDPNTLLWLSPVDSKDAFEPKVVGLVLNEAQKGCSAVFVTAQVENIVPGLKCYLAVGEMPAVQAEVRWRKDLDANSVRIGFEYQI